MLKLLRRTRTRTRILAGVLIAVVVAAGVYWFGIRDASAATPPEATSRAVAASLATIDTLQRNADLSTARRRAASPAQPAPAPSERPGALDRDFTHRSCGCL